MKNKNPIARPKPKSSRSANTVKSIPVAKGKKLKNEFNVRAGDAKYPGSIIVHGRDLISDVSLVNGSGSSVTYPIATNLLNFFCSPSEGLFQDARISRYGQIFEKFLFKKMKFIYSSMSPATLQGGLILAYDADPTDQTPPASLLGLQQMMGYAKAESFQVWEDTEIDCPIMDPQAFYYTSDNSVEERLVHQGQIYLSTASPVTVAAGGSAFFGLLAIEYEILLFEPSLEMPDTISVANSTTSTGTPVQNGATYNPIQLIASSNPIEVVSKTGNANINIGTGTISALDAGSYTIDLNATMQTDTVPGVYPVFPTFQLGDPKMKLTLAPGVSLPSPLDLGDSLTVDNYAWNYILDIPSSVKSADAWIQPLVYLDATAPGPVDFFLDLFRMVKTFIDPVNSVVKLSAGPRRHSFRRPRSRPVCHSLDDFDPMDVDTPTVSGPVPMVVDPVFKPTSTKAPGRWIYS